MPTDRYRDDYDTWSTEKLHRLVDAAEELLNAGAAPDAEGLRARRRDWDRELAKRGAIYPPH